MLPNWVQVRISSTSLHGSAASPTTGEWANISSALAIRWNEDKGATFSLPQMPVKSGPKHAYFPWRAPCFDQSHHTPQVHVGIGRQNMRRRESAGRYSFCFNILWVISHDYDIQLIASRAWQEFFQGHTYGTAEKCGENPFVCFLFWGRRMWMNSRTR